MSQKKQGVGILLLKNDQILLMKRGSEARSEQGKWEFCGGQVELGETFDQTAKREAKEELGVIIDDVNLLFSDTVDPIWDSHVLSARIIEGTPIIQEPLKCSDIAWFTQNQIKDLSLTSYCHRDLIHLGWI